MHNPESNTFVRLTDEMKKAFSQPPTQLTEQQRKEREWTRFEEGEIVSLKGVLMAVHEIGETRLVLRPVKRDESR